MSSHQPLLHNDIEPDDDSAHVPPPQSTSRAAPVVLTPINQGQMATNPSADVESGIAAIFRQVSARTLVQ
jgi:hypothetical protein